jgi:predicted metalloprotease
MGTLDAINAAAAQNPKDRNKLHVQLELQADCFAGIWAHSIRDKDIFSPGEIAEAMDTAAAIGDDRIQEKTTGQIEPESWTHGSSEQRVEWFTRGFEQGTIEVCDTFEYTES